MIKIFNKLHRVFQKSGYKLSSVAPKLPKFMDSEFVKIYDLCKTNTITDSRTVYGLYKAVEYVVKSRLKGDFVECGVWKGGSAMVVALTFLKLGESSKRLFLYDTYEGMSEPAEVDVAFHNAQKAIDKWVVKKKEKHNEWAFASLDFVKKQMNITGYPAEQVKFIKGKVEDSLPQQIPNRISILRLDTDWYESTKHELVHLFPKLVKGGVLIVDDYNWFKGSRKACDEYFKENNINIFLGPLGEGGAVIGIKN